MPTIENLVAYRIQELDNLPNVPPKSNSNTRSKLRLYALFSERSPSAGVDS